MPWHHVKQLSLMTWILKFGKAGMAFSHSLQNGHAMWECWFEYRLLTFQSNPLPMCLEDQLVMAHVLGTLAAIWRLNQVLGSWFQPSAVWAITATWGLNQKTGYLALSVSPLPISNTAFQINK